MVERHEPGFRLFPWVSMTAIQPVLDNPPHLDLQRITPARYSRGVKAWAVWLQPFSRGMTEITCKTGGCIQSTPYHDIDNGIVNGIVNDIDNVNDKDNANI